MSYCKSSTEPFKNQRICAYLDVSHSVIIEIRTGRKPLSTHAALVWFFATVDSSVSVQRTRR